MIAYPTDEELLRLTPDEFFKQDHSRSSRGAGAGGRAEFQFRPRPGGDDRRAAPTVRCGRHRAGSRRSGRRSMAAVVSSSRVRQLIAAGRIDDACRLLTRPYRLRGMVRHGAARGGRIGFPTANLDAIDTLLPGAGVYAGRAIASERSWPAAISIGPNPTFGERQMKIEVHLIGFQGSLYGQPLEVDFISPLARHSAVRRRGGTQGPTGERRGRGGSGGRKRPVISDPTSQRAARRGKRAIATPPFSASETTCSATQGARAIFPGNRIPILGCEK